MGWTQGAPAYFHRQTEVAHSGGAGMRLRDSHLAERYPMLVQPLSLTPGWYTLRAWLKPEGAGTLKPGAGGRATVWWGGSWASTPLVTGTSDWTRVERRDFPLLPGESASLRLEAYGKPDGTVYFDDIIGRVGTPATPDIVATFSCDARAPWSWSASSGPTR